MDGRLGNGCGIPWTRWTGRGLTRLTFLPHPLVQTGKQSLTTIKRVRIARPP